MRERERERERLATPDSMISQATYSYAMYHLAYNIHIQAS